MANGQNKITTKFVRSQIQAARLFSTENVAGINAARVSSNIKNRLQLKFIRSKILRFQITSHLNLKRRQLGIL
jgi:hypothetical protein